MRILLTGATGCVGSYLLKALVQKPASEIITWVREPQKLPAWAHREPRIEIWSGGLAAVSCYTQQLAQIDCLIHVATAWGGPETFAVNLRQSRHMMQALNPRRCQHIHYFSTASLLNEQHQLWRQSHFLGSDYIRSKAALHHWLSHQPPAIPVSIYYPGVILGGQSGTEHPLTPVSAFLPQLPAYLAWLRFLHVQGCLHLIHAQDIAQLICHRVQAQLPPAKLVLGNPALSLEELMQTLLQHYGLPPAPVRLPLEALLPLLVPVLRPWMSDWDRFSLRLRHLRYQHTNAATYGLRSEFENLSQILAAQAGV